MRCALSQTLFLLLSLFVCLGQSEFRLELIQVVMRHGQRAPLLKEMYPNDPYNTSVYEPWGLGQMTNVGKRTEYRIGTMLREHYDKFLGSIYHPQDVYAVSSDIDRTKMSLQLTLAGLYPPSEIQQWNADLRWLAIPTHYIPEKVDVVLRPHWCPVYITALDEVRNSKEVQDQVVLYNALYKYLSEKTGLNITESELTYELYNGITAQKNMNLTIEWCTDEVYTNMQHVMDLEYKIRSYTTQLKRLNGGMMIKRFIDNMNLEGKRSNPRKIYIYSGHEVNIAAFAKAHGIIEPRLPDYGSAFLFEKLRDKNDKIYVKILFWTGATEKLITIKLTGCEEICPVETYLELIRDVIPSEKETTCLQDNITKEELIELFAEKISFN